MKRPGASVQRSILLLCSFIALAAHWQTAAAQSDPPLVRTQVALDGLTLAVELPETHTKRVRAQGNRVIIDFGKNMRLQRLLIISREPLRASGPLGPRPQLPRGAWLSSRLEDDSGGGSGGPIAELNGTLEIDATELTVTCTDQSEWTRDPEWCLPLLARIGLAKAP